jgi:hypothetical protein
MTIESTIRDREDQREALRARIFGAQNDPQARAALIAELEAAVKKLDADIRELKAAREEIPASDAVVASMNGSASAERP